MWKYNCEKRNKYYDEVIRLYTQEGLGRTKISRIIPVGETTISRWIRNFASENQVKVIMKRRTFIHSGTPIADAENTEIKDLQAEIARLKKELTHESLRADTFNELINVAEKQFNISIRKKAGAKQ
ncbi:transposase [Prevotella ihumii]|uniref:transposase n=1 Tax=Prevotella ihumii TaxID=1917878 RepID=UPI0009813AF0|nr:transposase [Prevotella ihumii]